MKWVTIEWLGFQQVNNASSLQRRRDGLPPSFHTTTMPPLPQRQNSIPTVTNPNPSLLPSESILADLGSFKAHKITLPTSPQTPEPDLLLDASYDFVKNARAALGLGEKGLIENEGEKMERTREKLDQVLEGLSSHEQ